MYGRVVKAGLLAVVGLAAAGCQKQAAPVGPAAAGMQALPVQTVEVALQPVPRSSEYVATIKSRRSATLQSQVEGRLTQILVRSGDQVRAGQSMMTIDPLHQQATVESQRATEQQKRRFSITTRCNSNARRSFTRMGS